MVQIWSIIYMVGFYKYEIIVQILLKLRRCRTTCAAAGTLQDFKIIINWKIETKIM